MKKTIGFTLCLLFFMGAASSAFAGAGTSGAPWFTDLQYFGKTEYNGKLYILFQDTGKNHIPGGIGNSAAEEDGYREYVVEIQFILELVPAKGKTEPRYFTGIGKTCEDCANPSLVPECDPGEEGYYDSFYLPGDYVGRLGAALHSFLNEEVYPVLCDGKEGCEGFLTEATYSEGFGNAQAVVDPEESADVPSPPWYYIQPITIVTP